MQSNTENIISSAEAQPTIEVLSIDGVRVRIEQVPVETIEKGGPKPSDCSIQCLVGEELGGNSSDAPSNDDLANNRENAYMLLHWTMRLSARISP